MKKTTLDPTIIGRKFYTIANNCVMAEKITKVTFRYFTNCGTYWTRHVPVLHLKRADGKEYEVELSYSYEDDSFYKNHHPFYETPDDATEGEELCFGFPDIKALATEYHLGQVETESHMPTNQVGEISGRHHSQYLARYRWNGAKPVETHQWLFITKISADGFMFGLSDAHGTEPYATITPDASHIHAFNQDPCERLEDWRYERCDKMRTWLENTYPTKVECIDANKIEVVDFDD